METKNSIEEVTEYDDQELYEELEKSISENDLTRIQLIIERNPKYENLNYNKKLLIEAIKESSNKSLIKFFMDKEEDLNYEILLGKTPLFEALSKHNYSIVEELLKKGVDINYVNAKGQNALYYLKQLNDNSLNSDVINYLVSHNININLRNRQDKTFLECLIEEENIKLIETFLNCIVFSNNIIIQFVINSKNKTPVSKEAFNSIIEEESKKIIINKRMINTIIDKNNPLLLKTFLKYKMSTLNDDTINNILISSCKSKNIDYVKTLIQEGANVNCTEENTLITPLMSLGIIEKPLKIKRMNALIFEMFNLLIDAGANVNLKDANDKTALMYILSTKKASVKLIKLLVKHGAKINDNCNTNNSPLTYACIGNNRYILKFLLGQGADTSIISKDEKSLILHASLNGSVYLTQYLIENNLVKEINCVDKNFETPLMLAVKKKNANLVEYLLDHGADVNYINNKDESALSKLLSSGRISKKLIECLKVLIEHGADINKIYKISRGYENVKETPLIYAVNRKNFDLIELFINNGALIDEKDSKGATPLYYSVVNAKNLEIVEYLIKKGANVNEIINDANETALFGALRYDRFDAIKLLLENGADVNHKNSSNKIPLNIIMYRKNYPIEIEDLINDEVDFEALDSFGKSLFHYCIISGQDSIFNYIMDNIEDINIDLLDNEENTPLMLAVNSCNIEFATKILEKKPKLNVKNVHLKTALTIAVERRNYKLACLLIENGAKIDNSNIEINKRILHRAIYSFRLIQLLVKNGYEINDYIINSTDEYGNYLLSTATSSHKLMSTQFLLANNADPYKNNKRHFLPFQEVVSGYYTCKLESSKKLLDCYTSYGVDINKPNENGDNLMCCVATNSYSMRYIEDMLKYLIEEKNADANFKNSKDGVTVLMYLSGNSDTKIEFIKYLVEEKNCDVNAKDNEGNISLMYALKRGNSEVCNYLIEKCQDFTIKNNQGTNLLMCSVGNCDLDIIKKLIEKGVPLNDVDNEGRNALFYIYNDIYTLKQSGYRRYLGFYSNKHSRINNFKYLVEQKIDINCTNKEGKNILFGITDIDIIKYAVEQGVDIKHKDNNGCTIVSNSSNIVVIKYAISQGVDVFSKDKDGHSIIENFKYYDSYSSVTINNIIYLLEQGASLNDFKFGCRSLYYFNWQYSMNNLSKLIDLGFSLDSVNVLDNETDDEVKETFLDYLIENHYRYKAVDLTNNLNKAMNKKLFDIHRKNYLGNTPLISLMKALNKNKIYNEQYTDLIVSMINNGADLEVCGMEEKAPLYYALMFNLALVKEFYSRGAHTLSYNGKTKIMINIENVVMHEQCADSVKCEVVKYLEDVQQVNVNDKINGTYIIFTAIEHKCHSVIKYLLSKNVSLTHVNSNNETVMDVAKRINDATIISLIEKQEEWIEFEKKMKDEKSTDSSINNDIKKEANKEENMDENEKVDASV
ncbi:ankyrin [Piromyces finnis]|uniref:Ankyrin n=1 Tax=Piromyces finnis TaxID=1754191 RepID=A0A1Y1V6A6_9FUNG|nr:ankyrin [Piromyces finnis]|eukprot:ORX48360.1 ankyrin [Piromyces finnis]